MDQPKGKNNEVMFNHHATTASITAQADAVAPSAGHNKGWVPRRRGACRMCKWRKLSKKQHASNKSVGSVTSEEALSCRDENRDSTADVLAESPNSAQLPQNPTITPIGGGSSNNLQGMMGATDDSNIMPVFLDKYAEDTSWASYMDWTGNNHSRAPSSVDIGNVHGSGALSWPPSTKNTDSEFDLDIPFTVGHTDPSTALSLSSLLELELPLSSTGQTKDQDDPKPWGELISNMSLDEKASARTSFGLDEAVIRNADIS
ncbi:MAG: hypothetical protein M1818_006467 [Claussenomyces sp. TS43310]|nr:MAG: hypothetical protein M1818_006467 [Claussenomyces sp. TS43310]